ncbi:MAG: hypothetical protein ACWGMZ_12125 [Thermoguttaceae bacterium]
MADDFITLIGKAIHHCGVLEFFVNNEIRHLATDKLHAQKTFIPFGKRIKLLKDLLKDRSSLKPDEISSLCNDLKAIPEIRNKIAHNPIASDSPSMDPSFVLVVRNTPDKVENLFADDIKKFVSETFELINRMVELLPECRKCDKNSS